MASLFHRRSASSATSTTSSSSLNSPGEGGSGSSSSLFKRPLLNKSFFGSKSSNLSSQTPSDNSFDILLQSGETILLSLSNNGSTTDTSLELDQPPAALGPDDENDPSNHLVDLLKAENVRLNLQVVKLREELAVSRGESLSSLTLPTIDDNLLASLTSAAGPGPLGPGSESGDASPLMPSTDAGSAPSVDWEAQYMELKERSNKLAQQAVITIEDRMKRIQHLEGENGALFDRCQTLAYEILEVRSSQRWWLYLGVTALAAVALAAAVLGLRWHC
ncbi:hypothetical protein H696_04603 [Fonticula alba]|uniref:Uncharacterized protein n=1 Tax=Fonticula alba TaxID=691883 RepID=A0A058Z5H3_FONAL|nr:hypothetical protein H696_04603 [Fonticula alba]KCV69193.1 hypothetical protein H696_04603 [Fonticula alba]|eukprot:XP_009496764.1 hypothetical protein H696_04603 [Fonticula alba]